MNTILKDPIFLVFKFLFTSYLNFDADDWLTPIFLQKIDTH